MKHVPWRRCVACRQLFPRNRLLRILWVRSCQEIRCLVPNSDFRIQEGRSAYLCANPECLKAAQKGKKLHKALKTSIPGAILESLSDLQKEIS